VRKFPSSKWSSRSLGTLARLAVAMGASAGPGCIGPLVDDTPGYSTHVLPPGVEPPELDSLQLLEQIDVYDGLTPPLVERRAGWAKGTPVHYWDFGLANGIANPVWWLRRCDAEGVSLPGDEGYVEHPYIVDSVAGSIGYNPFLSVQVVCITDRYAGERLVSLRGLSDAYDLGLVSEPVPTNDWLNLPSTLAGMQVDLGDGLFSGTQVVYYRDRATFALAPRSSGDTMVFARSRIVSSNNVYYLQHAMTDDGYLEVVFAQPRQTPEGLNASYSPLVRVIRLTMTDTYVPGSVTDADMLVTRSGTTLTAAHPDVMSISQTNEYRNLEIQLQGVP
jgi:hypothetical protein